VTRRQILTSFAASITAMRGRAEAAMPAGVANIRWSVSSFVWSSTLWPSVTASAYREMLDVIKDTGFQGLRFTGWPGVLSELGMTLAQLNSELSKRGLRMSTMSFSSGLNKADDLKGQDETEKRVREACKLLNDFGATELVVFGPGEVNKVLNREHIRVASQFFNRLGDVCAEYGIRCGHHNHSQGGLLQSQDEIELMLRLTDPKKFHWCPDTVHLYITGCDIMEMFEKHAGRLIYFDLVDAKYNFAHNDVRLPNGKLMKGGTQEATFLLCNMDYGQGEVDLQGIMRILKRSNYRGWINLDHHYFRVSAEDSLNRCMDYVRAKLSPIYR